MTIRRFTIKCSFLLSIFLSSHLIHAQTYLENFLDVRSFVTIGETSYFTAKSLGAGWGLWKTNGTRKGTEIVKSLYTGSYEPGELFVFNNEIYFAGYDQESDVELWKSDGTGEGTYHLKNPNPDQSVSSRPTGFTIYDGVLYFTASNQSSNGPKKLFRTDGTAEGTVLAEGIIPEESTSPINNLIVANGKLYFTLGSILYETDGTAAGTTNAVIDGLVYLSQFHQLKSELYFITHNYNSSYIRLYRLSSLEDYTLLREFSVESISRPRLYGLIEAGGEIFFTVGSGEAYTDVRDALWKTDGTPEGTVEIFGLENKNLSNSGNFSGFVSYNGKLFFNPGGMDNRILWQSDGTPEGTKQIITGWTLNQDAPMVVANGSLYYLNSMLRLARYNDNTKESVQFSKHKNIRRYSDDEYFIKTDGRQVYYVAHNDKTSNVTMDLFNTTPNPLLEVVSPSRAYSDQEFTTATKVDSLNITRVVLSNSGNAPLVFSQVYISGEGFYLNGEVEVNYVNQPPQTNFPQKLQPRQGGVFELGFLPQQPGVHQGYLVLRSNDTFQSEFRVKLIGYASEELPEGVNATFPMQKTITWPGQGSQIQLDSQTVAENAGPGTVVGTLFPGEAGENFTYELVSGPGSEDNSSFTLSGDQLQTGQPFGVNSKNSYSIRVLATGDQGTATEESFIISVKDESHVVLPGECEKSAIPLTSDLNDVTFLNDTDAIAVGNEGVVLKTVNKGVTWQQTHVIEMTEKISDLYAYRSRLYTIQFVNETVGFLTGQGTFLRTDDAGLNWKPLEIPKFSIHNNIHFTPISSELIQVWNSYQIFESRDGGFHWSPKNMVAFGRNTLDFIDDSFGFSVHDDQLILRTTNGGENWETLNLVVDGQPYDEDIIDFDFQDANLGYALTMQGSVLKTTDGGLTWNLVNKDYRTQNKEIHFYDEDHGILRSSNQIFETSDGGVTWQVAELTFFNSTILGVATNSLGDRIAVGGSSYDNGRTIYYAPAGEAWVNVSAISGKHNPRNIIVDGASMYVFTDFESKKSLDGGVTWKELNTPSDGNIGRAEKLGTSLLIQIGPAGEFYSSDDGGLNWNLLDNGTPYGSFTILDASTIIAANMEGSFSKSTDAGQSWEILPGVPTAPTNVARFYDVNFALTGGIGGLSRTQDGGITWEEITVVPDTSIYIYAIGLASAETGVISTNEGYYKTSDGGDTWVKLSLYAGRASEIITINESEWYVITDKNIYITNDGGINWNQYYTSNYDILDADLVSGTFYFSDDEGGIFKIVDEEEPINAGFIEGDLVVGVGDEGIYSVLQHSDNRYAWEVEGTNTLSYKNNLARVTWNAPGTYALKITPYSSCVSGNTTEVVVRVYEVPAPPEISGPIEVLENSSGRVYTTAADDQASYLWSVSGHRDFQVENNTLTVDWGGIGEGEVGLIKTDLLTGLRSYARIDVSIVPQDPFSILQTDASCRETANGSIHISSRLPEVAYRATLTGSAFNRNIDFTAETIYDGLFPGSYDLCIEEPGMGRNYCYRVTISEPPPFEVSAVVESKTTNEISLTFKGGLPPYTILLNGTMVAETSQNNMRLPAANGDLLEVISAGGCAFSHTEVIYFPGRVAISPNPVANSFSVILGHDFPEEERNVSVRIFDMAGHQVLNTMGNISNNTFHGDLSELPSGFYIVQLGDKKNTSFKVIKK